ncbi:membrane protein insertase YidC [Candidatus Microgenomates bacterium]|nr:membrane protein insertase YidC [Candidatus Microgenomates bacterium]
MLNLLWNDFLYRPLLNAMVFLYNALPGHDLGLVIIVLTVLVRIIILPLGLKASRSQRKTKSLAPEIAKLKEQYKGNQQEFAKAQMELYKRYGVSPFSSCLPLLIQVPLIWALYLVLREGLTAINPEHLYSFVYYPGQMDTDFLGLVNLSVPDKIFLPVLAGISQYILTLMTSQIPQSGTPQEKMIAKQMTFMMPLITLFIAIGFPAGLSLYWVATTLFSIGQQLWVNKEKSVEMKIKIKKAGDHKEIVIQETEVIPLEKENVNLEKK